MSPAAALQSPVFLFYLGAVIVLLLVGGVVLVVLRFGMRLNVEHAWQAYRGWLVIVPVTALAIFLGREATIVFFTGVALLGFTEFARATGLGRERGMAWAVAVAVLAAGVVALVPDPTRPALGWYDLFMTLPVLVSAALLAIPVLRNRAAGQLHAVALAILAFIYFGWMCGHVAFLANAPEHAYAYLGYLLVAVEVSDVAAYLFGKLCGRHALRDNISPRKTWEGALGALAVSMALPWALGFTFPHLPWFDLLALGLILGIGGQLGDLAISVLKRDLGIKDMGSIIPGHGGMLDRIDSLVFVAPFFYHYLRYRHEFQPLP